MCKTNVFALSGIRTHDLPHSRQASAFRYLAGAFVEKYFQGIFILALVLFVLYREALVV